MQRLTFPVSVLEVLPRKTQTTNNVQLRITAIFNFLLLNMHKVFTSLPFNANQ